MLHTLNPKIRSGGQLKPLVLKQRKIRREGMRRKRKEKVKKVCRYKNKK